MRQYLILVYQKSNVCMVDPLKGPQGSGRLLQVDMYEDLLTGCLLVPFLSSHILKGFMFIIYSCAQS